MMKKKPIKLSRYFKKKEPIKLLRYFKNTDMMKDYEKDEEDEEEKEFTTEYLENFIDSIKINSYSRQNLMNVFNINEDNADEIYRLFNYQKETEIMDYLKLFLKLYDFKFINSKIFKYEFLLKIMRITKKRKN